MRHFQLLVAVTLFTWILTLPTRGVGQSENSQGSNNVDLQELDLETGTNEPFSNFKTDEVLILRARLLEQQSELQEERGKRLLYKRIAISLAISILTSPVLLVVGRAIMCGLKKEDSFIGLQDGEDSQKSEGMKSTKQEGAATDTTE